MDKRNYPPRVLLVIAPIMLCAFFLFTSLAGELTKLVTPYLVFGIHGRGISVVSFGGHLPITFSNGTEIGGLRLLPVDLVWAVLSGIFLLSFYFLCRRIAARIARGRVDGLASEVSDFLHFNAK